MKKLTKLILMSMAIMLSAAVLSTSAWAQLPVTESFENAGAIPAGWAQASAGGTSTTQLTFVTSGTSPTVSAAYNGTYMVRYNSYSIPSGNSWRLYRTTPYSTVGVPTVGLSFAMYHDPGYSGTPNEGITVQYSLNGTTWTNVGSIFPRYSTTTGWQTHTVLLPGDAGNTANLYVAFLFSSQYGNNIYMDYMQMFNGDYGNLTGTITNSLTLGPAAGISVVVNALPAVTSNASGVYTVNNIPSGTATVNATGTGYFPFTGSAVITPMTTTTYNFTMVMQPATVTGIVVNSADNTPLGGVKISAGSTFTYSLANGTFSLETLPGNVVLSASKPGFLTSQSPTLTLSGGTTSTYNFALTQVPYPPGPLTATLNTGGTAVDLVWSAPTGLYAISYDDGTAENYTVWTLAGNLNALKFSAISYPAQVMAGMINIGTEANYAPGTAAASLEPFHVWVFDATGTGGKPGNPIGDPIEVQATNFGWNTFTFPTPKTVTATFYLVMEQGGIPPTAAGLAIDMTNPQFRSYAKYVSGNGPWLPADGNFMMRAIMTGMGGPLDGIAVSPESITTGTIEGAIYANPSVSATGVEGMSTYYGFDWSAMGPVCNVMPAPGVAGSQSGDLVETGDAYTGVLPAFIGNNNDAPGAVLFNNGPFINSPGTGPGGADESIIVTGTNSYGFNNNQAGPYYVADDFTVTGDGWAITSFDFYGYQTGSTTTSTFTGVYVRVWNGDPSVSGSQVVWGDMTTNRMASTSFTNCYRVNAVNGGTTRPIMKIVASTPGLSLPAGNYWVEWACTGSLASGPWTPPISINGQPITGNAIQYVGTGYAALVSGTDANPQGLPFVVNGNVIVPAGNQPYVLWRLQQGEEANEPAWTQKYSGTNSTYTDTDWETLPAGPYRWAVKAAYPLGNYSVPVFSNVLGKNWTANVTINVTLSCDANSPEGTLVTLVNNVYPDTAYTAVLTATGTVTFPKVWKGNYTLTVSKYTYDTFTVTEDIMADKVYDVNLGLVKIAPWGLTVADRTLEAVWNPPVSGGVTFEENFSSGNFTANGWTAQANWSVTSSSGNPAPSAQFSWTPSVTNYSLSLTSANITGSGSPLMNLSFDINLSNYSTATQEYMAIEISGDNGATWNLLGEYMNSASIPWTHVTYSLAAYANSTFKIRFRAHGANSFNINYWYIDNVKIEAPLVDVEACVLAYNFYLNGQLDKVTTDTAYAIPPSHVTYGQTYQACVLAVFENGYSTQNCYTFTAHFLPPPINLVGTPNQTAAILTWEPPLTPNDMVIGTPQPRTEMPNASAEYSPTVASRTGGYNNDAMWDILLFFPLATVGNAGVATDGTYIYVTIWSGGGFRKYDATGNWIEDFSITGVNSIRDLCFDGTYFYGSNNSATLYQMDFTNKTLIGSVSASGISTIRHISFDPTLDGGAGGFWVGAWADAYKIKRNGQLISSVAGFNLSAVYGSAYDDHTDGGPYIWYFDQNGSGVDIIQYSVTAGAFTGLVKSASDIPGFDPVNGIAGGLDYSTTLVSGKGILLGLIQQDIVFEYELTANVAPPGPTVAGYVLYRDGNQIADLPGDQLEYWDMSLAPGQYCYEVTAKYDLTPFGMTGFAESLPEGPACVPIYWGFALPFIEDWTAGSFDLNYWSAGQNWIIDGQNGNPFPAAKFKWDPLLANYSESLETSYLDATTVNTMTPYSIFADFDLKLDDRTSSAAEKLTIEVSNDNGNTWAKVGEFVNNGDFNWTLQHIDITNKAKNKVFKLRFRANGTSSGDIYYWMIDNVNVHVEYQFNPALNLVVTPAAYTGTVINDNHLVWEAPAGPAPSGDTWSEDFEGGVTPAGWQIITTNTNVSATPCTWSVTDYVGSGFAPFGTYHAGLWWDYSHQDEWLITPAFNADATTTMTFESVVWEGSVYLDHYYVKVSTDDGATWTVVWDASTLTGNNWNYYAYPYTIDLTAFAGENIKVAFQAVDGDGQGLWYIWFVDNISVTSGDKKVTFPAASLTHMSYSAQATTPIARDGSVGAITDRPVVNSNVAANVTDAPMDLMGYNVYRRQYIDPIPPSGYTTLSDWSKINSNLVTVTEYWDNNLPNNCYDYYVTVVYTEGESAPSNIDAWNCIVVGVNNTEAADVRVYPNPATSFVNIDLTKDIKSVTVYNALGSVVMQKNIAGESTVILHTNTYAAGAYSVKFVKENGDTFSRKFVVVK